MVCTGDPGSESTLGPTASSPCVKGACRETSKHSLSCSVQPLCTGIEASRSAWAAASSAWPSEVCTSSCCTLVASAALSASAASATKRSPSSAARSRVTSVAGSAPPLESSVGDDEHGAFLDADDRVSKSGVGGSVRPTFGATPGNNGDGTP